MFNSPWNACAVAVLDLSLCAWLFLAPSEPSSLRPPSNGKPTDELGIERFELENGVRVAVLHVPGAQRQSTFTFVPFGFLDEGAGAPQESHLVEHLLIRASEPGDHLASEGVEFNGETGSWGLRLETLARPEAWEESLRRHARWLSLAPFDAETLARERAKAAAEIEGTAPQGFTGKWAQCAWNQVLAHGAEEVRLRQVAGELDAEALAARIRESVPMGSGLTLASVGPIEPGEVRRVLAEALGGREARPAPLRAQEVRTPERWAAERADRRARWDLPGQHYLEWYPLPGEGARTVALGTVLAQRLNMGFFQSRNPLLRSGRASASLERLPHGEWALLLSVCSSEAFDTPALTKELRGILDGLWKNGQAAMLLANTAREFSGLPDFDALRQRVSGRAAELMEANLALRLFQLEASTGLRWEELGAALEDLDAETLAEESAAALKAENRWSLLLEPMD